MCSIMGYCAKDVPLDLFNKAFKKTLSRGPDATRVLDTGEGVLGFHRLSIMGMNNLGMQPFKYQECYVVCNGEIYGFRRLKKQLEEKGFQFMGDSDCEILLPLYLEMGTAMFSILDAEFALILYDGRTHEFIAEIGRAHV